MLLALAAFTPPLRLKGLALLAASLSAFGSFASAATQDELEARVQALAEQLQLVQTELAALKQQETESAPAGAVAATPTPNPLVAPGASADRRSGPTFFGYGELNYTRPRDDSAATTADAGRFVVGASYQFDERMRFVSEVELEHAISSADDAGEVELEQAYIEREFNSGIRGKAGLILIPSGMLNEFHEPTRYYGVFRNFIETTIIPTTWREGGVAAQGDTAMGLRWDVGVTTGFDLGKWDTSAESEGQESPLGSIHQELSLAHARDLSGFAALNFTGIPGVNVGASIFTGGATHDQPGLPSADITLWEGHARWTPARWDLAALYARGHISGTSQINATFAGDPVLIPKSFFGWYAQSAYRVLDNGTWSLAPFVRYERFNTASEYADIGLGLTPAALSDRKAWTGGLNLLFAPGVVIKADYVDFQDEAGADRFDLGLGYQF
jgi:predicted porin